MSEGIVVQVIGAVIDVEFSRENLPKVYDALVIEESDLVLEVQQQLGDGVVRTIAMGQTEGLKRGAKAKNTGDAVSVPVGEKTLGRILNVLGDPITTCSDDPVTGFFRDGCCNTDENDRGVHTVCAKVTSEFLEWSKNCLLYTSPSPRDGLLSRMPSSA